MTFKEKKRIIKEEYPKVGCNYRELANRLGYKNIKSLYTTARRIGAKYKNTIFELERDEVFKPISEEVINHYKISNYGKIINKEGVLLKSQPHHQTGYLQIRLLDKDKKKVSRLVHLMVIKTFVGNKPKDEVCDHIDGDRQNPSLKNLQYITQSKNVKKQPSRKHNGYLTKKQIEDICLKLEKGSSISQITKSNEFFTKSMVEKIKQRKRHLDIAIKYNF